LTKTIKEKICHAYFAETAKYHLHVLWGMECHNRLWQKETSVCKDLGNRYYASVVVQAVSEHGRRREGPNWAKKKCAGTGKHRRDLRRAIGRGRSNVARIAGGFLNEL
jgi:hypothetical protein